MQAIRIIGIDPGLRYTGWGVIEISGNYLRFIASGTLKSDKDKSLSFRLCQLHQGLLEVFHCYMPQEAAVEETFMNKDGIATLKLAQARGIALLVPAQFGISVSEYAPNTVKKAILGVGHADKKQIQMMIKVLMPRATCDRSDAADALAVSVCHAHHRKCSFFGKREVRGDR
ncbi:MAG: crossover junction endodeoxyribonuclease RuvC [Candidatus Tokpelaia sp. JSC161]|jgi:crossover junction endodeoxyribonuclease RuvC|nr:MAG: crossover junction endodeoxyribonuclease RuvC [Candidatus Tokpelaia sp. JSC161]